MDDRLNTDDRPRVIVCGTRTFSDAGMLAEKMDVMVSNLTHPIIVTGAAKGVDRLAEEWACVRGFLVMRFHPDLEKHKSPAAFHVRNREMVQFALERRPAFCVAFHDGKSPGTAGMIDLCKKAGIQVKVFKYRSRA